MYDKGIRVQDISEPAEGPTAAAGRAAEIMGSDWAQGIRDIQAALETLGMQAGPAPLCQSLPWLQRISVACIEPVPSIICRC